MTTALYEEEIAPPPLPWITRLKEKPVKFKRVKAEIRAESPNCFYCEAPLTKKTFTVDHVIPKAKGGSNKKTNLVASCSTCNCMKSSNESFLLLKWKSAQCFLSKNKVMKICSSKEKLDLYQTIRSYLLLDQPQRAARVMEAYMSTRPINSLVNLSFKNNLEHYHTLKPLEQKLVMERARQIIKESTKVLEEHEELSEHFEFKYLINGEIYSEVPYFNLID